MFVLLFAIDSTGSESIPLTANVVLSHSGACFEPYDGKTGLFNRPFQNAGFVSPFPEERVS